AVAGLVPDLTKLISAGDKPRVVELGGAAVVRLRTAAVLDQVAALVVSGTLRPYVTRTFPLAEAARALRTVEDGHALGKIVIEVAP
ncbi:zinc-binding dehydrogenase, partial [Streptomyces niveus]